MLHLGEHPLATDNQPNRGASSSPAVASIQNGYPRRDRGFASGEFHQPTQPQRQGTQALGSDTHWGLRVDIKEKIADLNRM